MDIDDTEPRSKTNKLHTRKQRTGRVSKKVAKRKSKSSIVFADVKAKWRRQSAQKKKQ
jgi:hypothetical protein